VPDSLTLLLCVFLKFPDLHADHTKNPVSSKFVYSLMNNLAKKNEQTDRYEDTIFFFSGGKQQHDMRLSVKKK